MSNRFKVRTPDEARAARLGAVPGVVVHRQQVRTNGALSTVYEITYGLNAVPLVEAEGFLRIPAPGDAVVSALLAHLRERLRPDAPSYKKYQPPGLVQMLRQGLGLLRHPPGAGKSRMGIEIGLAYEGPRVIVTRASNRTGYVRELATWTRDASAYCMTGYDNGGEEIPLAEPSGKPYDFVLVPVETLQWHVPRLLRLGPRVIIYDECDLVKSTKRWKAVPKAEGTGVQFLRPNNRAAAAQDLSCAAEHRFGTTATPFPNLPKDGYAQGDLIEPAAFGTWGAFARRYCSRSENLYGGYDDTGASNIDELRARWKALTHEVSQAEVNAEMPPVRIVPAFVGREDQISPEELRKELAGAGSQERAGLMQAAMRGRGYALNRMEETVRAGGKVAIFTGWRADAERVAAAVAKRLGSGVRRGKRGADAPGAVPVVLIHGGTGDPSARLDEMRPYVDAVGGAVLVGTTAALGRSLDGLQCTSLALMLMLPPTPGELEQAIGRFPRLGRTVPCLVELVVPLGTYAERSVVILLEKAPAIAALAPSEVICALPRTLMSGAGTDRAFRGILESEAKP